MHVHIGHLSTASTYAPKRVSHKQPRRFDFDKFSGQHPVRRAIALGVGVFLCCLVGIAARLGMDLSNLWIANAFLLGMLVRFPALARPSSWLSAATAFVLADLVTGSDLTTTCLLSAGNLVSVAVAWRMLVTLERRDRQLQRPGSMWRVLLVLALASGASAVIGTVIGPALFGGKALTAAAFWFTTELVNHLLVLPLLLTLPHRSWWRSLLRRMRPLRIHPWQLAPLASLLASIAIATWAGGPAAFAFPAPALIWCALSYNLFSSVCLVFAFGTWTLLAVPPGLLESGLDIANGAAQLLFRFTVSMIILVALAAASAVAARRQMLHVLHSLCQLDDVADLRSRQDFVSQARARLHSLARWPETVAILAVDIDHFARFRQRFGRSACEQVLVQLEARIRACLVERDLLVRVGGEEFAVMLLDNAGQRARPTADAIRARVRDLPFTLANGTMVSATVCIGMTLGQANVERVGALLAAADLALYRAKAAGEDGSQVADPIVAPIRPGGASSATHGPR